MPLPHSLALQLASKSKRRRLSTPPLYAIDDSKAQLS
jgi:hypothetical protein